MQRHYAWHVSGFSWFGMRRVNSPSRVDDDVLSDLRNLWVVIHTNVATLAQTLDLGV